MVVRFGDRVNVKQHGVGTVKFYGNAKLKKYLEPWVGVDLDLPTGKHDGMVNGVRYFVGKPNCGVLVKIESVQVVNTKKYALKKTAENLSRTYRLKNASESKTAETSSSSLTLKDPISSNRFSPFNTAASNEGRSGMAKSPNLDQDAMHQSGYAKSIQFQPAAENNDEMGSSRFFPFNSSYSETCPFGFAKSPDVDPDATDENQAVSRKSVQMQSVAESKGGIGLSRFLSFKSTCAEIDRLGFAKSPDLHPDLANLFQLGYAKSFQFQPVGENNEEIGSSRFLPFNSSYTETVRLGFVKSPELDPADMNADQFGLARASAFVNSDQPSSHGFPDSYFRFGKNSNTIASSYMHERFGSSVATVSDIDRLDARMLDLFNRLMSRLEKLEDEMNDLKEQVKKLKEK